MSIEEVDLIERLKEGVLVWAYEYYKDLGEEEALKRAHVELDAIMKTLAGAPDGPS